MKKILAIMAAFCAIGCSGGKATLPAGNPHESHDMTNVQLRNKLVMALDDMKSKAVEMGIEGAAASTSSHSCCSSRTGCEPE